MSYPKKSNWQWEKQANNLSCKALEQAFTPFQGKTRKEQRLTLASRGTRDCGSGQPTLRLVAIGVSPRLGTASSISASKDSRLQHRRTKEKSHLFPLNRDKTTNPAASSGHRLTRTSFPPTLTRSTTTIGTSTSRTSRSWTRRRLNNQSSCLKKRPNTALSSKDSKRTCRESILRKKRSSKSRREQRKRGSNSFKETTLNT